MHSQPTPRCARVALSFLALVALAPAGCAAPAISEAELVGTWAVSQSPAGVPPEFAMATIEFTDEYAFTGAGCNGAGGGYSVRGNSIRIGSWSATEVGCDPKLHEVEDLLYSGFTDLTIEGEEIVMPTSAGEARFIRED
ncbi:META domain-containing protein [Pseudoclavibacter sp. RFBA6]|uniref:META domain-containing protein n=1 Tax=Pseudoclavibacter sp. RFBA6 TaxID=2080573 RepID=UPI0015E233BD|nr:META domain-containing protein [Pseudoclavibacter sp. RFBA6]